MPWRRPASSYQTLALRKLGLGVPETMVPLECTADTNYPFVVGERLLVVHMQTWRKVLSDPKWFYHHCFYHWEGMEGRHT